MLSFLVLPTGHRGAPGHRSTSLGNDPLVQKRSAFDDVHVEGATSPSDDEDQLAETTNGQVRRPWAVARRRSGRWEAPARRARLQYAKGTGFSVGPADRSVPGIKHLLPTTAWPSRPGSAIGSRWRFHAPVDTGREPGTPGADRPRAMGQRRSWAEDAAWGGGGKRLRKTYGEGISVLQRGARLSELVTSAI